MLNIFISLVSHTLYRSNIPGDVWKDVRIVRARQSCTKHPFRTQSRWLMGCAAFDCQVTDLNPGQVTEGQKSLLANGCSVACATEAKGGFSCSDLSLSSLREREPSGAGLSRALWVLAEEKWVTLCPLPVGSKSQPDPTAEVRALQLSLPQGSALLPFCPSVP